MFPDSWGAEAAPRYPKKWIFHPRKRSMVAPLLSILAAGFVIFEAFSHL